MIQFEWGAFGFSIPNKTIEIGAAPGANEIAPKPSRTSLAVAIQTPKMGVLG